MSNPCPVLLINLVGSKDRLATAQAEMSRAGVEFERIEAVDGRLRPAEEIARLAPWDRAAFFKALSPGEVGCYLSHLAAAERIVKEGWPRALVMEDDFRLTPAFAPTLRALMALPEVPHLVKLEGSLSGGEVVAELASGNRLVRHRRPPVRTVALFWSLEGARRFLAVAHPLRRPVDVQLKHWWEGDLEILAVSPAPVTQDEKHATASTIGARRPQGFAGRLRQWRYRLGYAFESQWHLLRRRGFGGWLRANFG
jgi:glycosyl transferase family 25